MGQEQHPRGSQTARGAEPGPPERQVAFSLIEEHAAGAVAVLIGLLLGLCWLLGVALGGAAHVAPHWFYVPILLAALRFGTGGALVTAALATLVAGPLLPADRGAWTPQEPADWLSRGLFFVLLGLVFAQLLGRVQAAFAREVALVQAQRDAARAENAARQALEEKLRHQAFHDALTGLPNRRLLHDRLEQALRRATRTGTSSALLFLDLDDFKTINDSLGHATGDALLQEVSTRLRQALRPGDTVARLGGDEFALLLEGSTAAGAHTVTTRVLAAVEQPVVLGGQGVSTRASIGIALSEAGQQATELLRNADAAMYAAKRGGKGRYAVFAADMHAAALDRLTLRADLQSALTAGALELHYQPIVALESGLIESVEALVRWTHPSRGPISPALFVPLAEESDLIVALDAFVLQRACAQVCAWSAAGLPSLRLAVNLSGRSLHAPAVVEQVRRTLQETGLAPAHLDVELTETVAVSYGPSTLAVLEAFRALGVGLALDDFGTGYATLQRLHHLPFTMLKIDQSFIRASQAPRTAALVQMMVGIGQSLGLAVVAEGVETLEQDRLVRQYGCTYAQGYAYSRPVAEQALTQLLLLQGAGAALGTRPGGEFVRPLLEELARLTGLEATYVTRIDWPRAEQEIVVAHTSGALVVPEGLRVAWSDTLCRRALEGGPRYTAAVPQDYPDSAVARELRLQTYVSVPVLGPRRQVVGTLCGASSTVVELGASALAVMEHFAGYLAAPLAEEPAEGLSTRA